MKIGNGGINYILNSITSQYLYAERRKKSHLSVFGRKLQQDTIIFR